jgi:hypothetical protein
MHRLAANTENKKWHKITQCPCHRWAITGLPSIGATWSNPERPMMTYGSLPQRLNHSRLARSSEPSSSEAKQFTTRMMDTNKRMDKTIKPTEVGYKMI